MKRLDSPASNFVPSPVKNAASALALIGFVATPFVAHAQTSLLPGVLVQGKADAALPTRSVSALSSLLGEDWLPKYVAAANSGGIERVLV